MLDSDPLPFFSHCVFLLLFCFYFLFFFFGRLRRVSPSVSGDESGRNASFIRRGGSFVCSDAAAIHRSTASFPRTHFFLPYFPVSLIKSFFVSVCLCVCVCVCVWDSRKNPGRVGKFSFRGVAIKVAGYELVAWRRSPALIASRNEWRIKKERRRR